MHSILIIVIAPAIAPPIATPTTGIILQKYSLLPHVSIKEKTKQE